VSQRRVIFFRVVSAAELVDIRVSGLLRPSRNSVEGKHLTDTIKSAKEFGQMLYIDEPFWIVKVRLKRENAREIFSLGRIDNRGNA
jgi:hypothetical protein